MSELMNATEGGERLGEHQRGFAVVDALEET